MTTAVVENLTNDVLGVWDVPVTHVDNAVYVDGVSCIRGLGDRGIRIIESDEFTPFLNVGSHALKVRAADDLRPVRVNAALYTESELGAMTKAEIEDLALYHEINGVDEDDLKDVMIAAFLEAVAE